MEYEDKEVYPEMPERLSGSKNDGDSDNIKFSLKVKKGNDKDRMIVEDWGDKDTMKSIHPRVQAKNIRYREYR